MGPDTAVRSEVLQLPEAGLTAARERMGEVLRDGQLVVAPTDTVYGVYADITNPEAVERLLQARGASQDLPPPVLLHSGRYVTNVALDVTEAVERLMAAYWPGPLTMLFRPKPGSDWALGEAAAAVAIRMPAEPLALQVLYDVGALACTAACRPGDPPPTTLAEARSRLGDDVSLYIDDGPRDKTPSTVVDMTRGSPDVLREGDIAAADIAAVGDGQLEWGQRPTAQQEIDPATEK